MHATHCSHAYTYTKCSLRYLRAAIQIKSVHRVFILLVNVCVALHRSVAFSCTAQIRIDRPEGNSRKVDTDIASQQRQRTSHLSAFDFWNHFFLFSYLCCVQFCLFSCWLALPIHALWMNRRTRAYGWENRERVNASVRRECLLRNTDLLKLNIYFYEGWKHH